MKRRSSKVFAATLALLVCLNAMPFGALAADEDQGASVVAGWQIEDGEQSEELTDGLAEDLSQGEQLKESDQTEDQAGEQSEDEQPADVDQAEEPVGEQPAQEPTEEEQPTSEDELPEEEPEQNQEQAESQQPQPNTVSEDVESASDLLAAPRVDEKVYYVSEKGNDETGDGTEGTPFASLAKAAEKAMESVQDGDTIRFLLLSDLTMEEMAYIGGKIDVTIDGQGYTIFRGDNFVPRNDLARGGYNPELIEVANGATLTLLNITLDDRNKTEGSVYAEQFTGDDKEGNENKVQGAMIAAYGDGKGTIILGSGTTLKNFGGMSAVRIGGNIGADDQWHGSTLIMESGSQIIDDDGMGTGGRKGGFAAVWNQGGYVEMKAGSSISNIDGRAIYCDNGGTALINGEISDITSNEKMEGYGGALGGGFAGIAIYATPRTSVITLGETGKISGIKSHDEKASDVAISLVNYSTFNMLKGSSITGINTIGLIDCNGGTMNIDGTVSDCHTGNVFFRMRNTDSTFNLGKNGSITNCSTTDAGIIYLNQGKPSITISGEISNITDGKAIWISNNGPKSDGTCTVTGTGVIKKVSETAIQAEDPSHVSIYGTIMDCGGYAVDYKSAGGSYVEIKEGATIQGNNKGNAQICLEYVGDVDANDTNNHMDIAPGTLIGNQSIKVPFGTTISILSSTITLDEDYAAIGLGKAGAAAVTAIETKVKDKNPDWEVIDNSLWVQPSEESLHFTVDRPYTIKKGIGLYVGYIPLKADGTPADDAELTLLPLANTDKLDITLTGLTPGTSYALAFVVENKYYVTINPADITVYMGGEDGAENVVNDKNEIVSSESLPTPGFTFELPYGVTDISKVTFKEVDGSKTWKAVPYDEVSGHTVYKLVATGKDQQPVRVQFTDKDTGKVVVEDDFQVGTELNKTFSMGIYKGSVMDVEAVVDGSTTEYGIILNEGTLTVRGTTGKVQYSNLSDPIQPGKPGVKAEENVTFTINDSPIEANQDSIALLFDNIIENTNNETGRSSLLAKRVDEQLADVAVPDGMVRNYQFRYLDLVDTSNGNAWVDVKDANGDPAEVTVCWPYPEGTNKDTEFKLLHFEKLHREMDSNAVAGDIANCEVSEVSINMTDTHIEFTTTEFSPFALVWNGPKPVPPVEGEESSDNGNTTTTPAATPAPTAQPVVQNTAAQTAAVIPQTSDDSQPALWAGLLGFSGAALTALYLLKRRKENRGQ